MKWKVLNRGEEAKRRNCIRGQIVLDDGKERIEVTLDNPAQGLVIESFMWREMYDFTADCVLMVLADQHYDESDYIRDYNDFLEEVK